MTLGPIYCIGESGGRNLSNFVGILLLNELAIDFS